jgi:hypothetical protein
MSRALRLLVACLTHLFRRSSLLAEQSTAKNAVLLGFFDFILPSRKREEMTDPEEKFHPGEMTEQEHDAALRATMPLWKNGPICMGGVYLFPAKAEQPAPE